MVWRTVEEFQKQSQGEVDCGNRLARVRELPECVQLESDVDVGDVVRVVDAANRCRCQTLTPSIIARRKFDGKIEGWQTTLHRSRIKRRTLLQGHRSCVIDFTQGG